MTTHTLPLETLPVWMRRAQRSTDWGALLALLFSFALALPFLLQPTLPNTNGVENFAFRTADYVEALREGVLYPRWSPHALTGYGAPIPHYYPPAAPYSAALLHIIFTGDTLQAVQIVFALAYCIAGLTVYALVKRRSGGAAGLIACLLYTGSPYVAQTVPHILGDLSGMLGLALLPALLWSADRVLLRSRPFDLLLAAGMLAALILSDARYALAGLMLTGLLAACQMICEPSRRWLVLGAALLLGAGLASFFWLPALLEREAITWLPGDFPSIDRLSLSEIFAPLRRIDPAEMTPTPHFTLGISGWVALSAGVTLIAQQFRLRQRAAAPPTARQHRSTTAFHTFFLTTGMLILASAVFALPTETWLIGVATLCIAVAGSGALAHLLQQLPKRWYRLALPALLVALNVIAVPVWLIPLRGDAIQSVTPERQIEYELNGFGVGVLPPGADIPTTLTADLPPNRALLRSYQTGRILKINNQQIGGRAQIGVIDHTSHSDLFQVETFTNTTLNVLTAYFPGWRAVLDDLPVGVGRSPASGLLRVSIAAGRSGELRLSLEDTPLRSGAWLISLAALGIIGVATVGRMRRNRETYDDIALLDLAEARLIGLVAAMFIVALIFMLRQPQVFPQPGFGVSGRTALNYRSDVGLEALAFHFERREYRPGDTVEVTIYWRALRSLTENYRVRAALVRFDPGLVLPHTPLRHPGGYPTRRWALNRYVTDPYRLPTDAAFLPGQYLVALEVFGCNPTCAPATRPTFFDQNGVEAGQVFVLPTFITIQ